MAVVCAYKQDTMGEFETSKVYQLAGSVDYAPGAVVSKMISKKESGNITLFAFDKDQVLSEHSAPYDAIMLATCLSVDASGSA